MTSVDAPVRPWPDRDGRSTSARSAVRSADPAGAQERSGRGRLVLADGVLEKIAGQIVSEVGGSYGTSGGFLGIGSHADQAARPKVDVTVTDAGAELAIRVGIAYPTSIRTAAQQIRDAVTGRLTQLTGVQVGRVDIDVAFLAYEGSSDADGRDASKDAGRRSLA